MLEPYSLLRRAKSMKWKSILTACCGRTFSIRRQTENEFHGGDNTIRKRSQHPLMPVYSERHVAGDSMIRTQIAA